MSRRKCRLQSRILSLVTGGEGFHLGTDSGYRPLVTVTNTVFSLQFFFLPTANALLLLPAASTFFLVTDSEYLQADVAGGEYFQVAAFGSLQLLLVPRAVLQ